MPTTTKSTTRRQRLSTSSKKPITRRVLQVITPSHMSGAEMQLARLTKQMTARGHVMPVLVKHGSPAIPEMRHQELDVDVARIGGKVNIAAPALIARAAKRHNADIVQSTLSSASWWCGWMESFGGPKSIGHVQGFTSANWHSRQTHLLCVSNAIKQHMVDQGIEEEKITVLLNALGQEEFLPTRDSLDVRQEFGADASTPVVGTFGHLSVKKGYRELFDAIPRILHLFPTTQFWVMGTGKLHDELEQKASAEGFLKNVRFNGFRRDTADLMNAIDVMALPSHREPCALVYIEAALSARPIVGCKAGGAPESIADGETGLLVPVGDGPAVAEAIITLLDNRDFARRMGEAGRQRAQEVFSWRRFTETLEGVYERVLDS
ncbi:glycosyltransferase family 4 protein [Adhaeretor mobilis]|uniref:D-inositol 3-phosphate glycosyltransferase n=1 Tax=Adhaeretor mobilis TaxID=1930276 RepID=A0A517MRL1_9BACT|nr:glycosyltransferase family 4 protein [Adhaeretor mobilis]QDS97520.1 D-inositol 3-phosphate glycosyltransferase [Adhaeretor mobilis]